MEKKNKNIVIAVIILAVLLLVIGGTYAFIELTLTGEKKQTIVAGTLSLELLEDNNNLTITDALPMYDEVGMIQKPFTFRIVNNGTASANYVLKLVDITTGDKLSTSDVKYGLTNVTKNSKKINLISTIKNGIIDVGTIKGKNTIEYELRLWIDDSVKESSMISGKSLNYRIDLEVGQLISEHLTDVLVIGTEFNELIPSSATAVVFTSEVAPSNVSLTDVSFNQDMSVVSWSEGSTYKVSTQREGVAIQSNPDSYKMFYKKTQLTEIDLSNLRTDYVENMRSMFAYCINLTELDVSHFNTENATNMRFMFGSGASVGEMKLTSLDVSNWDTSNVTDMTSMFQNCCSLESLDVSKWDTGNVTNMSYMFASSLSSVNMKLTSLDVSNWDTSNVADMSGMFERCGSLKTIDVSKWNTSKVKNMSGMFAYCVNLTELDVSHFNTENVTDMQFMFAGGSSYGDMKLTSLDVSNWDTSQVTNMQNMFCYNILTTLDVSKWDTSQVKNMGDMFENCSNLTTLDVSKWNTSQVTNFERMFNDCHSLTYLNVGNFNTSSATDMSEMFEYCYALTIIDGLENFNTSKVTIMSEMFSGCRSLTKLNLSSFDTSKVTGTGVDSNN